MYVRDSQRNVYTCTSTFFITGLRSDLPGFEMSHPEGRKTKSLLLLPYLSVTAVIFCLQVQRFPINKWMETKNCESGVRNPFPIEPIGNTFENQFNIIRYCVRIKNLSLRTHLSKTNRY